MRAETTRSAKRVALALVVGVVAVLGVGEAGAHVTVSAQGEVAQGSFARLVFNVPNERDAAATTGLQVTFPEDQPIPNVSVKANPGWTYEIQTATFDPPVDVDGREVAEAVSSITWTGGAIQPGEFDQFVVSAGPLPNAEELVFAAVQTYDNGEQVRWIEEASETGEEPELPAPVLTLTDAPDEADEADDADDATDTAAVDPSGLADEADLDTVKTLSIIAIVVGGLGVVLGGVALLRRRAS